MGGQGVQTPLKNGINIWFLSNPGPDPLKNHKATKSAFHVGPLSVFCWGVDGGPLIVVFGSSFLKKQKNKEGVSVGTPLAKLSGSVHVWQIETPLSTRRR